jgi:hypothetical protein
LQLRVQDAASATWAPWPTSDDFALDTAMSARVAFNFVRGVRERGEPLRVDVDGVELRVIDALSYHAAPLRSADIPTGVTQLRFRDGVVLARVTPTSSNAPSGTPQSSFNAAAR